MILKAGNSSHQNHYERSISSMKKGLLFALVLALIACSTPKGTVIQSGQESGIKTDVNHWADSRFEKGVAISNNYKFIGNAEGAGIKGSIKRIWVWQDSKIDVYAFVLIIDINNVKYTFPADVDFAKASDPSSQLDYKEYVEGVSKGLGESTIPIFEQAGGKYDQCSVSHWKVMFNSTRKEAVLYGTNSGHDCSFSQWEKEVKYLDQAFKVLE
jgi:hypothetical protein